MLRSLKKFTQQNKTPYLIVPLHFDRCIMESDIHFHIDGRTSFRQNLIEGTEMCLNVLDVLRKTRSWNRTFR